MSNIDMSRLVPADTRATTAAELRAQTLKTACSARILEVADQIAQTNLAAALAAGRMSKNDAESYRQLLDWIAAMRRACRMQIEADAPHGADTYAWPDLPASVADIADRF